MATTTPSATILLVSQDTLVIDATRAALANEENLHLIERPVTSSNLFQVIAEAQPDVILLDFESQHQPFYLVYKITSFYPTCAVVAILPEAELIFSERAVQAGARASIQFPYPPDNLVITLKRIIDKLGLNHTNGSQAVEPEKAVSSSITFTVFSPKGGAGCTTIAANLAISLHDLLKEDVLLVDGKHVFGHVALHLNLLSGNSITDLIAHADMLDEQLIKQVVEKHNSGIHVLPSPNSIVEAQGIKPESLFKVIQSIQQVYSTIIIDGGNNLNDNTVTYLDSSDKILLVFNPDLASMRDVRQFIEISATLSYPKEKILLILNLTGRKTDMKSQEIENILKMKIIGKIPADEDIALSSLNEGVPILLKKPRHAISKAYGEITKELVKIIRDAKAG